MPGVPRPMLATAGELPAGPGWAYELKWDGIRALAAYSRPRLRLYARSGAEVTGAYPELRGLSSVLSRAGLDEAVLDGEVVLLDEVGVPSFARLAERMHIRVEARAARLAAAHPVTYMIFDIVEANGNSLLRFPYEQRRSLLESVPIESALPIESAAPLDSAVPARRANQQSPEGQNATKRRWMVPPYFTDGQATMDAAASLGLEGVVAKRLSSPYRPGLRTPDWVKVKHEQTADLVVGGWRRGQRELGALLVGVPGPGGLRYRGRVGGGISATAERELLRRLSGLRAPASPFATPLPREDARGVLFVRPELVVEVRYGAITRDSRLRFPRFLRLRPDKAPEDTVDTLGEAGDA